MAQRKVFFDIQSLLNLLTHYTEGKVPSDAEVKIAGPHSILSGWFAMVLASRQWPKGSHDKPLVFRYEGKRNIWINKHEKTTDSNWAPEAPQRKRII